MIDFKKAIHLISSISAKGNLKNYFETNYPDENIEIYSIHDPLTVGPLNDLTSSSDFKTYADIGLRSKRFVLMKVISPLTIILIRKVILNNLKLIFQKTFH